jgi:hypothetical protein
LDEPFIDGFGRMCHEDAALEFGLCKDKREGGSMIQVETAAQSASVLARRVCLYAIAAKCWVGSVQRKEEDQEVVNIILIVLLKIA